MQIETFVGHRPRPPSSPGVPLFLPFLFHSPLSISRSGVAAGILSRTAAPSMQAEPRRCRRAPVGAGNPGGDSNSADAASPRRWIVRAGSAGLLLLFLSCYFI